MYIGSHHKLKDTFIVFKEKKTSTGLLLSSHVTSIHNLLVGSAEELRTVLEDAVSAVKTPVFIVYVTASTQTLMLWGFSLFHAMMQRQGYI